MGGFGWVVSDRSELWSGQKQQDSKLIEIDRHLESTDARVDRIDRMGTTRGQPIYPLLEKIQAELQTIRSKQDRWEGSAEYMVRSLDQLQRDRGLTPPPRTPNATP